MPTVFVQNGLAEAMHVHVFKSGHECKIWLADLTIAFNRGFKPDELAEIRRMVQDRAAEIAQRWVEHGRRSS